MTDWSVTIPLSLAPYVLSKNGRAHWRVVRSAFRNQKDFVYATWLSEHACQLPTDPWPVAVMDVAWWYARGVPPDSDNVVARVAGARDAFQEIGLVRNDRDIRIGWVSFAKTKVGDEHVVVTLREGKA